MNRFFKKPGSLGHAPGSLVPIVQVEPQPLTLTIIRYGSDVPVEQSKVQSISECFPFDDKFPVTWLRVAGSLQVEALQEIGKNLDIHPLTL